VKSIRTALVVEDNKNARAWLEQCVAMAFPGVVVSTAKSLREAHHAIGSAGGFNLVLVDIGLPDGNGIDLIGRLAGEAPACLAVVTTIYDDSDHLYHAIQAGAAGYLLKYHETEKLVELLKRIHDGEPPLSPAIARRMMATLQAPQKTANEEDASLTPRESEVLALLGRGFHLAQVAAALSISQNTASSHVKSIYRKLNISTRAEAAVAAIHRGLMHN
jgi:DNA-binding NarL/FixJ family response regulator